MGGIYSMGVNPPRNLPNVSPIPEIELDEETRRYSSGRFGVGSSYEDVSSERIGRRGGDGSPE